ncbi:hypothetical protein P3T39_007295 [Kitasatospora sp. GP82]|nr:hypothetical protein [Kitasatospora sp. GP82]
MEVLARGRAASPATGPSRPAATSEQVRDGDRLVRARVLIRVADREFVLARQFDHQQVVRHVHGAEELRFLVLPVVCGDRHRTAGGNPLSHPRQVRVRRFMENLFQVDIECLSGKIRGVSQTSQDFDVPEFPGDLSNDEAELAEDPVLGVLGPGVEEEGARHRVLVVTAGEGIPDGFRRSEVIGQDSLPWTRSAAGRGLPHRTASTAELRISGRPKRRLANREAAVPSPRSPVLHCPRRRHPSSPRPPRPFSSKSCTGHGNAGHNKPGRFPPTSRKLPQGDIRSQQ